MDPRAYFKQFSFVCELRSKLMNMEIREKANLSHKFKQDEFNNL